jgi:hypothetical protein
MARQTGAWPTAGRLAQTTVLDVSSPSDLEAVERNGADLLYIFDNYISGTLLPSFHPLVILLPSDVERRRLERHILSLWGGLFRITLEVGRARIAAFD